MSFALSFRNIVHGWFAINSRSKQSVTMKHRLTIHSTIVTSTWNGYQATSWMSPLTQQ